MGDPSPVLRLLVLFLLATGCDLVLGFDLPAVPDVCGPFGAPTPLVFAPALEAPRDFSVDATGTQGMVHARRMNAQGLIWTGPHAITLDATGTWIPDDTRDRPVLNSLDGAHIMPTGSAFGWIDGSSQSSHSLYEYAFSTGAGNWGQLGGLIDPDLASDNQVGNVVDLPVGGGAVVRDLVEIKRARSGIEAENQIAILRETPGDGEGWQRTGDAEPLNIINQGIAVNGAVLTADRAKLVYAARVRNNPQSRLFASRRANAFSAGTPVSIDEVPAEADLTEPWIDHDCGTLYFRRDGTTWMTRSLDDPSPAP